MTTTVEWDDTVLAFQLDHADVRGRIARLDNTLEDVLCQHDYPAEVSGLVAEAAMLTALIGQSIKLRWKLSLQIRGDGPIRLIATDYYGPSDDGSPARIRAYASYDAETLGDTKGTPFQKIGKGMFAVLIDQGNDMKPYQGITPLAGNSLANCAEMYFAQSEQLPTQFAMTIAQASEPGGGTHWRAGGMMLQHMPTASKRDIEVEVETKPEDAEENWVRATTLMGTVEETELIGPHVSPTQLLTRLFHEEAPRTLDLQSVKFGCTCSEEKVRQTMSIYSAKDIGTMTTDDGLVTADCQFCGSHYEMDPKTLGFEAKE